VTTFVREPATIVAIVVILLASFGIDRWWKQIRG
jgi:hypothetical protein